MQLCRRPVERDSLQETAILQPLLADEYRLGRRLHIVAYAARADALYLGDVEGFRAVFHPQAQLSSAKSLGFSI